MEYNYGQIEPKKGNRVNVGIWIVGGIVIALSLGIIGFLVGENMSKSDNGDKDSPEGNTVVEATSTPTPTPTAIAASELEEIILNQPGIDAATVSEKPTSIDGVIYQADVYEYLTVRMEPKTSAQAICLLPPYSKMEIIENTNAQMVKVYIEESNIEGYVNREYINPAGSVTTRAGKTPQVIATDATIYYADVHDTLTLREAASTKAKEVTSLPPYTAMQIIERSGNMAYVYVLDSGLSGWVNTEYIVSDIRSCTRAGRAASGASTDRLYYANVKESLTVREGPSTSAAEICTVGPNTAMIILERNGKMAYIRVADADIEGWVNTEYLR